MIVGTLIILGIALFGALVDRRADDWRRSNEADAQLRLMIEAVKEYAIYTLSLDGRVTGWNAGAERMSGYKAEEIIGQDLSVFRRGADRAAAHAELAAAATLERSEITGNRLRRDGTEFMAHSVTTPLRDKDGVVTGFVRVTRDITEQTRTAEELDAQREFLNAVLNSVSTGIVACDGNGLLTLFNQAAIRMHGLSSERIPAEEWAAHYDLLMADGETLMRREDIPLFRALNGEMVRNSEMVIAPKNLKRRRLISSGQPIYGNRGKQIGAVIALEDITDRVEAEEELRIQGEQLRQAQKMEAVGQLAGGVAHDFNNVLTAIRMNAEMMLLQGSSGESSNDGLRDIVTAVDRAGLLTRQLLAFSRKQVIQPAALDINGVVAGLEAMMRRLLVGDVELVTELAPGIGSVMMDRTQMEQVIVNLVLNARDAMPDGGRLTIRTASSADDQRSSVAPGDGRRLLVTVTDTGIGMTDEVKERIFEPFFSTKDKDKGTGLGLATVYGIVTHSGGQISVVTAPGSGTTFTVSLPRVDDAEPVGITRTGSRPPERGREMVLIVDDEEVIRRSVGAILRRRGYDVVEAASGPEALAYVKTVPDRIDLLLTDVMMPEMHGGELIRSVRVIQPGIKALCMSGYADDQIISRGFIASDVAFIQKPFSVDDLTRRMREVLDSTVIAGV